MRYLIIAYLNFLSAYPYLFQDESAARLILADQTLEPAHSLPAKFECLGVLISIILMSMGQAATWYEKLA